VGFPQVIPRSAPAEQSESGVALRFPPQSKALRADERITATFSV